MLAEAYPQLKAGGTGSNPVTRTNGHSIRNASGSAEMVPMWRMAITFGEWCSGNTTFLCVQYWKLTAERFMQLGAVVRGPIPLSPTITGVAQSGRAAFLCFPPRKWTADVFGS